MIDETFKKNVELIKREKKYEGTILTMYEDTVKVSDKICKWDYLENSSVTAVLPILDDGRILLVKQYRLAVDDITIEIPAGKLDKNEEPMICAKRELEEETGYKSDDLKFLFSINSSVTYWNSRVHIFIAKNLKQGIKKNDEEEETNSVIYSVNELIDMINKGIIYDSKTVAAILAYVSLELKSDKG